ncbi:MAG TPA: primase-helicase family protein [Acidobacteriaceae bacterium]|nr:primase-helicase family protein [Acidobacteriaceae bacterium]
MSARPMLATPSAEVPIGAARSAMMAAINREYALLMLGNRPVVLHEITDANGEPDFEIRSVAGFHDWMKPRKIFERDKTLSASREWIGSEDRRQYDGLVFDPSGNASPNYYNIWRGFSVEPADADTQVSCKLFLDHLYENVCDGNDSLFSWIVEWFARIVQYPADKTGTALVLRGGQGVGKTIVGRHMGSLYAPHYELVADSQRVVGRFNSHLKRCILLHLDEATWGGDHAAAGKLKDLVTGEWHYIEYKGHEPARLRNYIRLLVTGNNNWLVPAGMDERRFAVLDVAEHKRQDHSYFRAIDDEMNNGGREALLRYLLSVELGRIPSDIPRTAALAEQQINSLPREEAWWLEVLRRGVLPGDFAGNGQTPCQAMHQAYIAHMTQLGNASRITNSQLGQALSRMVPDLKKAHPRRAHAGGRAAQVWMYAFPPLAECRKAFAKLVGELFASDDESERWEADTP